MSDYDDLGKILIIGSIALIITTPIWGPIYCVAWCFKHKEWEKEEAINKEKNRKEQERIAELNRIAAETRANHVKQKPWSQEKIEEFRNNLI